MAVNKVEAVFADNSPRVWFGLPEACDSVMKLGGVLQCAVVNSLAGNRLLLAAPHVVGRPTLLRMAADEVARSKESGGPGLLCVWIADHKGEHTRRFDIAFKSVTWLPLKIDSVSSDRGVAHETIILRRVEYLAVEDAQWRKRDTQVAVDVTSQGGRGSLGTWFGGGGGGASPGGQQVAQVLGAGYPKGGRGGSSSP